MMRSLLSVICWLGLILTTDGGTRALTFVHQPLTTLGTDQRICIVIARVPVLTNAVPEGLLGHVASPNELVQDASAEIADSNLLSRLGILLSVVHVEEARYTVTLDLSSADDPASYGVTLEAVVAAVVECIDATIVDTNIFHGSSQQVVWKLELKADPETLLELKEYQREYEPRNPVLGEEVSAEEPVGEVEPNAIRDLERAGD